MTPARQGQATSDQLQWVVDPDDKNVEYASYQTSSKAGWIWREAFKRTRIIAKKGELLPGYRYDCIATNDLDKAGWEVFKNYNKRARIENTNCELKNDYNLGKVVTQSFAVNDIITQSIVMLYQLVSHFKRTCLDKGDQRQRLGTLRVLLFNVPARLLSSGRRHWLRVQNVLRGKLTYGRILARLNALKTILVVAHRLDTG